MLWWQDCNYWGQIHQKYFFWIHFHHGDDLCGCHKSSLAKKKEKRLSRQLKPHLSINEWRKDFPQKTFSVNYNQVFFLLGLLNLRKLHRFTSSMKHVHRTIRKALKSFFFFNCVYHQTELYKLNTNPQNRSSLFYCQVAKLHICCIRAESYCHQEFIFWTCVRHNKQKDCSSVTHNPTEPCYSLKSSEAEKVSRNNSHQLWHGKKGTTSRHHYEQRHYKNVVQTLVWITLWDGFNYFNLLSPALQNENNVGDH